MTNTHKVPSAFLKKEGFPVINHEALSYVFDCWLDENHPRLYIPLVDEQFSASEVLYRIARDSYDLAYSRWSQAYVQLQDGNFLHKDYAQSAWDCWTIECDTNGAEKWL